MPAKKADKPKRLVVRLAFDQKAWIEAKAGSRGQKAPLVVFVMAEGREKDGLPSGWVEILPSVNRRRLEAVGPDETEE